MRSFFRFFGKLLMLPFRIVWKLKKLIFLAGAAFGAFKFKQQQDRSQ